MALIGLGARVALNGAAQANRVAHRNMMRNSKGGGSCSISKKESVNDFFDEKNFKRVPYGKTYEEHYKESAEVHKKVDKFIAWISVSFVVVTIILLAIFK